MKKFLLVAVVVAAGMLCGINATAADQDFSRRVLDNGLTVIVNELPSSPMVSINIWVKTGSANEGPLLGSGVTHFVEHMLFKGTATRGAGVIPAAARAMGGSINASTGKDHTEFHLSIPREAFAKGLDLMTDMMRHPLIDPVELENERAVILKESRMINDRPDRKLDDVVAAAVYRIHPYQHPIIGYGSLFKSLTRDQVAAYYQAYYAPNNMIVSVAGGINKEEAQALVEKMFGDMPRQPTPVRMLPQEPLQIIPRLVKVEYPTDLYRLVVVYQGMPLFDEDLFAGDVLASALSKGVGARLYQELHEKERLVEGVDAVNDTPLDRGTFEISCLLKEDNVDKVLARIDAIIADVVRAGFSTEELDRVRRALYATNIYMLQTAEGVASRAAMEEALTGDARFSDRYLTAIRAVTNEDVKRVAAKYLVHSRRSVVVLTPEHKGAVVPVADAVKAGQAEKIVLSNGLRVILKQDKRLPVVSVTVVIRAGSRETAPEDPGLAELTGRVWGRGVKGKPYLKLHQELESRAGGLSTGGGIDSLSLGISVLSEDTELALEDMELLLKSPTFSADDVEKVKKDMTTEREARKDSIVQTTFRGVMEALFRQHPMHRDPLGTPASLARFTRDDLSWFFHNFISPKNMVISVYGDIDPAGITKELERRLGGMSNFFVRTTLFPKDPFTGGETLERTMDKEQAFVVYAFQGPARDSADRYALDVVSNALSSPLGGRLFKKVRDELGKAYGLSGGCSPGLDIGFCSFYVLTAEADIPWVRSVIEEELRKVADGGLSEQEMTDARTYLKSDFARGLQPIGSQGSVAADDELFGPGFSDQGAYAAHIDAVTPEDVVRVVREYFDLSRGLVAVTHSSKGH